MFHFYCIVLLYLCYSLLRLPAVISPGLMDHQHFLMWTLRFLSVSMFCILLVSLYGFLLLFTSLLVSGPCRSLSNQTSQVNWRWLWARWVVGNRLCCWQLWERCSVCQEQSPGTGQSQVPSFYLCTGKFVWDWASFYLSYSSCVRVRQLSVLHQIILCRKNSELSLSPS